MAGRTAGQEHRLYPQHHLLAVPKVARFGRIRVEARARTVEELLVYVRRRVAVGIAHPVSVLDLRAGQLGVLIPRAPVRLDQADDVIRVGVARQDHTDLLRLTPREVSALGARPATGPNA